MAGSAFGLHIRQSLLGDKITSSELNTLLSSGDYLAGLKMLVNTPSSLKAIITDETALNLLLGSSLGAGVLFNSSEAMDLFSDNDIATEILMRNSDGLNIMVQSQKAIQAYNSSTARRTRINQFVNQSGYKLKRQTFTTSGTFNYSDTLKRLSIFLVGAGGDGSTVSVDGQIGQGGGGGEVINIIQSSSFLASGATIVIGANANTTINTTTFIANKGTTGDNNPLVAGTGGGSNTGDNVSLYLPNVLAGFDVTNNFWNYGSYTLKGGNGGSGASNGSSANQYLGTGGQWINVDTSATGGTGIGSGGSGGIYSGGGTSHAGGDGQGYGCGGASANRGGGSSDGSNGLVQFTYIIQ